jgi:hypothetical protein
MPENVTGEESASDPMKTVADALEKAAQTATDTVADAKATFERSLPAASRFVSRLVYTTCYSLSYGVVFPTVWVAKSIPPDNQVVTGLAEGAKAAIDAVDHWKNRQLDAPASKPGPPEPSA